MTHTRISTKDLQGMAYIINLRTPHNVRVVPSQGCGTYLYIDGVEYSHKRKDGTFTGLANKAIYEILKPLQIEAFNTNNWGLNE